MIGNIIILIFIFTKGAKESTRADPNAWIKKYFKALSVEYTSEDRAIIGIKESKFNSNPNQAVNQVFLLAAIKAPKVKGRRKKDRQVSKLIIVKGNT